MDKKKWVRPILTVLIRSIGENIVLWACKMYMLRGPQYVNCTRQTGRGCGGSRPPAPYACGCENLPEPPPGEAYMCICCFCDNVQPS